MSFRTIAFTALKRAFGNKTESCVTNRFMLTDLFESNRDRIDKQLTVLLRIYAVTILTHK